MLRESGLFRDVFGLQEGQQNRQGGVVEKSVSWVLQACWAPTHDRPGAAMKYKPSAGSSLVAASQPATDSDTQTPG